MFTARVAPVSCQEPSASFDDRLSELVSREYRVAYYYAVPDSSTFRYRVHNMVEAIGGADIGVSASWFTASDGDKLLVAVEQADVVVLCRSPYTDHVGLVASAARARGARVVFDTDDLVFDLDYVRLVMETLAQRTDDPGLDHWFAYIARLRETLRLCDAAIATNEHLASRIRDVHPVPTSVVPNFLNQAQLDLSAEIFAAKAQSGFARDGSVEIGYFSGTPTHSLDFAVAVPALARMLERNADVTLKVVGMVHVPSELRPFGKRVRKVDFVDWLNLQREIGSVEINIAPLQCNTFTNCKSDLKYFEAAVVGAITVASPAAQLSSAIRDGETGFLSGNQDWDTALQRAVDELPELPRMVTAARDDAVARYSPSVHVGALQSALL